VRHWLPLLPSLRDWVKRRESILVAQEDEVLRAARDEATTDAESAFIDGLIEARARNAERQVELWEFPRDFDIAKITEVAQDRLTPPDAEGYVLSSSGDTLTVQVLRGGITEDADMLVYVGGRGVFEVTRREVWPEGRVLLTLAAWPRP
jgi:hypothetical protein